MKKLILRFGGCPCSEASEIVVEPQELPIPVYGGWDGNFDPNFIAGYLEKPGDVVQGVCGNCLSAVLYSLQEEK